MKKRELKEITLASAVQNGGEIRYAGRLTRKEAKSVERAAALNMYRCNFTSTNKQGD